MIHVSDTMIRRIDGLDLAETARELGYTLLEWDDGFLIPEKEVYLKDNKWYSLESRVSGRALSFLCMVCKMSFAEIFRRYGGQ
ncbi:MAG: hypothetical protein II797_01605 [Clostridia bacterium]|nr:hypothetical protein [Clostridia bacterium]